MKKEKILVVPAANFESTESGFNKKFSEEMLMDTLRYAEMHPRFKMEEDENYRQIIPYVVVKNTDGMTLCYQRSTAGGEDRLHEKYSIGIGGHIDEEAAISDPVELFYSGMIREVKEELGIDTLKQEYAIIGSIFDPSNDVGRVHFGVVVELKISNEEEALFLGEENIITNRSFMGMEEIKQKGERLENWSAFIAASAS